MSKSKLRSIFAANVRELRKRRGLSQDALARKARVSPRYVAMVEKCEGNPTMDSIEAFAKALGVTPPEILETPSAPQSKGKLIRATIRALEELETAVD